MNSKKEMENKGENNNPEGPEKKGKVSEAKKPEEKKEQTKPAEENVTASINTQQDSILPDTRRLETKIQAKKEAAFKKWMFDDLLNGSVKNRIIRQVTSEIERDQTSASMTLDDKNLAIEQRTRQRLNEITRVLDGAYQTYVSVDPAIDPENTDFTIKVDKAKIDAYEDELNDYVRRGLLDDSEVKQIMTHIKERIKTQSDLESAVQRDIAGREIEGGLVGQARYAGIVLLKDQKEFLQALEDPIKFKEELSKDKYYSKDEHGQREFDIEKFWEKIRDICEEAISVIDLQPDLFFEQAFDPFYHARFYNQFMSEVRAAAFHLQGNEETNKFANQMIDIPQFDNPANYNRKDLGFGLMDIGKSPVTHTGKSKIVLADAIASSITIHMAEFRDIYQYLHDADKIIQEGAGWETLAKYAEKAKSSSMDWFFLQDKDLGLAYQLYIPSLKQALYKNGRIAKPDINFPNHTYGLDKAQDAAFMKLVPIKEKERKDAIEKGEEEPDGSEDKSLRRRMRYVRRIRLGSAAAKAYTFEYWNIWSAIAMPQTHTDYIADPNFPEGRRLEYQIDAARVDAGIDKMKLAMDWEGTARQFKLPREMWALPYVFIPRNFKEFDSYRHVMVYEAKKMVEDAVFRGASDQYLKFFPKYQTLGENLRSTCLSHFLRRNWRTRNYERFIFNEKVGDKEVCDFAKSMANLLTVGTPAVHAFIEEMKRDIAYDNNFKLITDKTYEEMMKNFYDAEKYDKWVKDGKPQDSGTFQDACFKEFILKRMQTLTPTKMIQLERRQYTPFGEKLIIEDLWGHLIKKYGSTNPSGERGVQLSDDLIRDTLTPLFVESLELVERTKVEQFKAGASSVKTMEDLRKLLNNPLDERDIQNPNMKDILHGYFDRYKNSVLKLDEYQGKSGLDFMNFDTFYEKDLPEFLKVLKGSIGGTEDNMYGKNFDGTPKNRVDFKEDPKVDSSKWRKENITLVDRFHNWSKYDLLTADFGGEDCDFTRFFFQRGGNRIAPRFVGEENMLVTKSVESLKKLYEMEAPSLVRATYSDDRKLLEEIEKKIVPLINEARDAWGAPDAFHRPRIVCQHAVFLERLLGRDNISEIPFLSPDMPFIGDLMDNFARRMGKRWIKKDDKWITLPGPEGSFYQDAYASHLDRPTFAANSNQKEIIMRTILNKGDVPWDTYSSSKAGYRQERGLFGFKQWIPDFTEYKIEQKEFKLFGKKLFSYKWPALKMKKTAWENAWNADIVKKVTGHEGIKKFAKNTIFIMGFVMFLLLLQLGLTANKANTGKQQ